VLDSYYKEAGGLHKKSPAGRTPNFGLPEPHNAIVRDKLLELADSALASILRSPKLLLSFGSYNRHWIQERLDEWHSDPSKEVAVRYSSVTIPLPELRKRRVMPESTHAERIVGAHMSVETTDFAEGHPLPAKDPENPQFGGFPGPPVFRDLLPRSRQRQGHVRSSVCCCKSLSFVSIYAC
jgi:hypothetical protein